MSDNYKKEKLDNLFKSTFDEVSNTPAENGWDLPSNHVWDGVDAHLRPQGGLRGGLIWWLLGIGLLVIAGWAIYWAVGKERSNVTEIVSSSSTEERIGVREQSAADQEQATYEIGVDEQKKELAIPETEQQVLSEKRTTISDETTRKVNANSGTESIAADIKQERWDDEVNNRLNTTSNDGHPENKSQPLPTKSNSLNAPSKKQETVSTDDSALERPANNKNNISETNSPGEQKASGQQSISEPKVLASSTDITANENAENLTSSTPDGIEEALKSQPTVLDVEVLATLPLKKAELVYERVENLPIEQTKPLTDELITPTAPKTAGFYIGLETSVLESYRNIMAKGDFLIPRFYAEEQPDISLGFGMNIGYQISRNWSIETGLNYTSSALRFRSRRQIRYTRVDEQPNDAGEFQRNYDFAFDTSNGTVDSDVALARSPGTDVAENDFIGLVIVGKQNFNYLNVPILARYHFGKGPWQLGLKAGVVNQLLLNASFQFESVNIVRPGVRLVLNERFFQKRSLEKVNTYQADFEVGASLRFFATDQLWIYAEPTYRRSINPSHENNNFKTFSTVKAIEIGLGWRF